MTVDTATYFRHLANYNAAPSRDSFAPTDSAELAAIAATYPDAADAALDAAINAADAGMSVLLARDEDGDWFAVAGDSLLELPFEALSLGDQFAALDAARRLAAEDAAADRAAGVYPVTDARSEYIHDVIPPPNIETVSAYLAAYAAAGDWWE